MNNPKLAAEIAKQLRDFHQVEVPGSKEPQLWNDMLKFFEKGIFLKQKIHLPLFTFGTLFSGYNFLMDALLSFSAASNLKFDDGEKQRIYETISFKEVHKEIIELKVLVHQLRACSPLHCNHNPLRLHLRCQGEYMVLFFRPT